MPSQDVWKFTRVLLDIGPLGPLPKKGVSITFSLSMNLSITNEAFLSDPKNKKQFIDFLGTKLTNQGCQVFYDQADADLLIVQKTIESATSMDTVLIGEDTDLLVLLIHHMPSHGKEIFSRGHATLHLAVSVGPSVP